MIQHCFTLKELTKVSCKFLPYFKNILFIYILFKNNLNSYVTHLLTTDKMQIFNNFTFIPFHRKAKLAFSCLCNTVYMCPINPLSYK